MKVGDFGLVTAYTSNNDMNMLAKGMWLIITTKLRNMNDNES